MNILAVDTAGKTAAMAVLRDDVLLYEAQCNNGLTHSETLLPMIDTALKACGLTVDGANYNLIAELPTDVQFANENADLYRSMSNDFSAILKSLTFSKGVTRTEVTAPVPSTGSGS